MNMHMPWPNITPIPALPTPCTHTHLRDILALHIVAASDEGHHGVNTRRLGAAGVDSDGCACGTLADLQPHQELGVSGVGEAAHENAAGAEIADAAERRRGGGGGRRRCYVRPNSWEGRLAPTYTVYLVGKGVCLWGYLCATFAEAPAKRQ
jgi:hypothetical protein